jgi:hypothetical protein
VHKHKVLCTTLGGPAAPQALAFPLTRASAVYCLCVPPDPDLYCYDERAIGGAIRPHHPPHRSIKFMCRCQPERLRFRLDPEHLQAAPPVEQATGRLCAWPWTAGLPPVPGSASSWCLLSLLTLSSARESLPPPFCCAGSRAAAAAAARAHVVYLFHPVQPCLLAVMQDIETAMAERVTLFTRL